MGSPNRITQDFRFAILAGIDCTSNHLRCLSFFRFFPSSAAGVARDESNETNGPNGMVGSIIACSQEAKRGILFGLILGGLLAGFLCGLVPYAVGERKGQPALAERALWICTFSGLGLGFLLAVPVAIIFVAMILNRARTAGATDARNAAGVPPAVSVEYKTCPKCAEQIRLAAVVCRFCGHQFSEADMAAIRDSVGQRVPLQFAATVGCGAGPVLSQARFCTDCGTPTVPGDKFCVTCGRRF